jgi:hypothetical protein
MPRATLLVLPLPIAQLKVGLRIVLLIETLAELLLDDGCRHCRAWRLYASYLISLLQLKSCLSSIVSPNM